MVDWKGLFKNLAVFATVFIIGFFVIELVLHYFYPVRSVNPANATIHLTHAEYDMIATTNSFGLRDRDYSFDVPEDVYRIMVVGDSFVFGVGMQNNETFVKVFEKELNENSSKRVEFEVLNAGKSGTGPNEYLDLVEHYSNIYDYDMLMIAFYVGNDVVDTKDPYINEGLISLLKKSRIVTMTFNFLTELSQRGKENKISNILIFNAKRAPQFYVDSLLLESDEIKESLAETLKVLLEINDFAESKGKKVVFVIIPSSLQVSKKYHMFFEETGFVVKDEFLTNARAQAVLDKFFERQQIDYVDLLGGFKEHADEDLYFKTDDHVSRGGQELIGKLLAAGLEQSFLNSS